MHSSPRGTQPVISLLGVPLDRGPCTTGRLVDAVHRLDPVELRRHLLGAHAWSWSTLGGADDRGRRSGRPCASRSCSPTSGTTAAGRATRCRCCSRSTRRRRTRLAHALEVGARLLVDKQAHGLQAAAAQATTTLASAPLTEAIEQVTAGYRYVPEPEAERVLLVPHVQPEPWLVLAQHRGTRLIVYQARAQRGAEERVAALGRALADPKRVEILSRHAAPTACPSWFQTGLARRCTITSASFATRLIDLEGNARAYRYLPRQRRSRKRSHSSQRCFPGHETAPHCRSAPSPARCTTRCAVP